MRIKLASETVFPLSESPAEFPRRRGRKVHVTTVYRWAKRGLGGVRLETIQVGGTLYTSREAIQRFCDRRTRLYDAAPVDFSSSPTSASRQAAQQLDELGI